MQQQKTTLQSHFSHEANAAQVKVPGIACISRALTLEFYLSGSKIESFLENFNVQFLTYLTYCGFRGDQGELGQHRIVDLDSQSRKSPVCCAGLFLLWLQLQSVS